MLKLSAPVPALLLCAVLMSLATGCATKPMPLPAPSVRPAEIPKLPEAARQPLPRSVCKPTCLQTWSERVENWRLKLKNVERPGPSAKPSMTPSPNPENPT